MNLSELKTFVDNAIENAKDFGEDPAEIIVSIQIDDTLSDPLWSDDVELTYDCNVQASGCVLHGWTPDSDQGAMGAVILNVVNERKRQDKKWGGPDHDDKHLPLDWCEWVVAYATWAKMMAVMDSSEKYRRRMIQVAALAVAAVQSHDRQPS